MQKWKRARLDANGALPLGLTGDVTYDETTITLEPGQTVVLYPEGTRSRDGRVGRFKGGSFHLALEAGMPVVPLSVIGSRHVMLKGRLATYPGHVHLVVHDPIDTSGLSGTDPKAFGERVRQIIAPDAESDVSQDDVHPRA